MESNLNIKNIFLYDTKYCADSVEWCPHEPNQNVFVCGNYHLMDKASKEDKTTKRLGRILLFSVSIEDGLKLQQAIDTEAVLDQKWCYNKINDESLLGVATAANNLDIYRLSSTNLTLELICSHIIVSDDDDAIERIILSLDWSTAIENSSQPRLVCSDSKGNVHLLKLENNCLSLELTCKGHEYEAWIAAFYYWDTNIFFSGGDDSVFLKFDRRTGVLPVSKNRKHEAGVTSIHSNYSKEYVLATGSYDEHVRLWDIRNMKTETSQLKMPGPLWRLKWDPFVQKYLLAACMLGGLHVVDAKQTDKIDIIASFYDHKNITYGADWCYRNESTQDGYMIGSCSFYDRLLCISNVVLE